MVKREKLRGRPLDDDCKKAHTSTHEYGKEDDRVFCLGLIDMMTDDYSPECVKCGAFVDNAKPIEGRR